jgi:ClpP class serine protease
MPRATSTKRIKKVSAAHPAYCPWAISKDGLDALSSELTTEAISARRGQPLMGARGAEMRGNVAVMSVFGPLMKQSGGLLATMLGLSSYEAIAKDFTTAVEDPSVKAILFNFDSPGGEAAGVSELAKMIAAARGSKPLYAYVSGDACSAAYWLASAADRIVCSETANLGSIGCRTVVVDDSQATASAGVRIVSIVSSQSPFKTTDADDEEDMARVQTRIDAMAQVFIDSVAANRGVTSAEVMQRYGQGDQLVGRSAVEAGMADEIGTFEGTLSKLQTENSMKSLFNALALPANATESDALITLMKLQEENKVLMGVAGCEDATSAVAKLTAWKHGASEAADLKAKLQKQQADAIDASFESSLKAATDAGVIPPAADHPRRKFAMSLKGQTNCVASLTSYVETLGPIVQAAVVTVAGSGVLEPRPQDAPMVLTADERRIAAQLGIKTEELAANKARRISLVPIQSDDDDEAGAA